MTEGLPQPVLRKESEEASTEKIKNLQSDIELVRPIDNKDVK